MDMAERPFAYGATARKLNGKRVIGRLGTTAAATSCAGNPKAEQGTQQGDRQKSPTRIVLGPWRIRPDRTQQVAFRH